ncbi:MAG: hypothetical protein ACK4YU_03115 [Paracoccus sp. (in: a-proteobacteria)]
MFHHSLIAACLVGVTGTAAIASSDEAWQAFRETVASTCEALATEEAGGAAVEVFVNPFGSASYGAAILRVTVPDLPSEVMVCIFDKQAGTAELTGPFEGDVTF